VLEGEAGIGKSTLWLAGVEAARERGLRVLSSEPAEAERGLAHTGLGDLFESVLDRVAPVLAPPRRRALEVALLVEDEAGPGADRRTLGVAVRSAVQALAADGPLVLAVDDVQWLDVSSASALAFALRRLGEQPILLLLARRLDEGAEPSALDRTLDADRVERLPVGPLSLGAIERLLRIRLGRTFSRPTLLRVHEASGGNPFYALELAGALAADVDPTRPLPVPEALETLVQARLDGLTRGTRHALVLASALGRPSSALLAAAGITEDVLQPALTAGVIELADGTLRFTHPVLASVLYQGLGAGDRRRTHGRLAEIVDEPLERARHLALSTEKPKAEIAATLEEVATLASARGAPIAAAELGEHALRLTPSNARDDRHRRAIAAARAHWAAGASGRARALAQELLAQAPPGPQRAEALMLVSEFEPLVPSAIEYAREALREPEVPAAEQAHIHQWLAGYVHVTEGASAAEYEARASLEITDRLGDDALRAWALSALALVHLQAGEADAFELCERAYELASSAGDSRLRLETTISLARALRHCFDLDAARDLLQDLLDEWSERDEEVGARVLAQLSGVEVLAGRFVRAASCADRARELVLQYAIDEQEQHYPDVLVRVAHIAAHRGDLDHARATAAQAGTSAEMHTNSEGVLGLVDLWSGDAPGAVEHFAAAEAGAKTLEIGEPALYRWRPDYAEALLQLGLIDRAVELLDAWEADAGRLGREWVLARLRRPRALAAAAIGDVERAVSLLQRAIAEHDAVGDPFGRARALLALGTVRRRARQKRAAREAIEAALEGFEAMGAAGWAEKARAELGRIGGRAREKGLTPAESRVAALVAEGRTNREVAATLFLGERTVETHLTHIYAKLGVRSRTELARRLR
jgi:DNA-binding CsgD family transcriptional regulator